MRITKRDARAMKRVKAWLSKQGYITLTKSAEVVNVYRNGNLKEVVLTGAGDWWLEALHDAARKVAEKEGVELPAGIVKDMEGEYAK